MYGQLLAAASYTALQAAERDTPQEVRFRAWAQQLTSDLLARDTRSALPGARDFAARVGAV